ncbi:hypothetical protein LIER_38897 [Lithospermum erythrorhizon]|uniref:ARGOS-like protein n=1 Tax=Lithospermum erythrorhizon TaxID=34254 RepID=A0AAV3Q7P8_LITER
MSVGRPETRPSKGGSDMINLQDQYFTKMMDIRTSKNQNGIRSFSQGHNVRKRKPLSASYFGLESLVLLLCLTASLLILPLILPPLPPPPSMLLLVPICILAVLIMLAFTPLYVHANGSSETTLTTPSSFSQRTKI